MPGILYSQNPISIYGFSSSKNSFLVNSLLKDIFPLPILSYFYFLYFSREERDKVRVKI